VRAAVELHQPSREAVELPAMQPSLSDHAVQHLSVVETLHHHKPVDDLAGAIDGQARWRARQRNDIAIDVWGETPVEPEFGTASPFATG